LLNLRYEITVKLTFEKICKVAAAKASLDLSQAQQQVAALVTHVRRSSSQNGEQLCVCEREGVYVCMYVFICSSKWVWLVGVGVYSCVYVCVCARACWCVCVYVCT